MPQTEQHEEHVDLSDIRWKMLVACDICRRRKVRCDGERPCLRCSKGGKKCTFLTRRRIVMQPEDTRVSKRPRTVSTSPEDLSSKRPMSPISSPRRVSSSRASRVSTEDISNPDGPEKEHLLLIDSDDQLVYSGPSTGMFLFARLGLLHTVEVSESDRTPTSFTSHSAGALGITGVMTSSSDYFDVCLQKCPQQLMFKMIDYHLNTPVFFPLLHTPSFVSELVAVSQRRLPCTAQYGAFLMSILAVTARLVDGARALLPLSERDQAGEVYFELAQDFIRISRNKLDIRHILALYHLALFAEGCTSSSSFVSSFVSEAVGLAFTTGLHRSTNEFKMDPVTLQVRSRLFWALYTLDISLAYSQGRPPLIRLSECSIDLPVAVDNEYIKKEEILPQPEDDPPLAMVAAVKTIEMYMVLEQILSAINAPSRTPAAPFFLSDPPLNRGNLLKRAQKQLDEIERSLPPYLSQVYVTADPTPTFFYSCRVQNVLKFVRTLIARQVIIDEIGIHPPSPSLKVSPSYATLEACHLSVDVIKTYSRLRHLGLLRVCGFHAVSHVTAAAHTLIACMFRCGDLAFEHRPDLLTAIDILLVFSSLFPSVETVAQFLFQLLHAMDHTVDGKSRNEGGSIRVLASKMARPPSNTVGTPLSKPAFLWSFWKDDSTQYSVEPGIQLKHIFEAAPSSHNQPSIPNTGPPPTHQNTSLFSTSYDMPTWVSMIPSTSQVETQASYDGSDHAVWGESFSFLNDGLFGKL